MLTSAILSAAFGYWLRLVSKRKRAADVTTGDVTADLAACDISFAE